MTGHRRRRSVAEAEREILDSADRFLRSRPLRELTIDEVMANTSLSRLAFYAHFRDRHDLVLRLFDELGGQALLRRDRAPADGSTSSPPVASSRASASAGSPPSYR